MYATVNLPGSSNFEYYGPATKQECHDWLMMKRTEHKEMYGGLWINTYYPARIVSNKDAHKWKYRDGSRVIREGY